jgi:1-acyl-sn-glycerol-3-phosphate acyltransferase
MTFAKIRGLYVFITTAIWLLLLAVLTIPFKRWNAPLRKYVSKLILMFSGAKVTIEGRGEKDTSMFIINHQSMMDIMALELATENSDLAWVAKKELFDIPLFGGMLQRTEMINLDRENRRGIVHLLRGSRDRLDKDRTIAIFPEGTRNSGDGLLEFKQGASIVANRFNLKVQPVVIRGTGKLFDVNSRTSEGRDIYITFLPQLEATEERDWLNESREKMMEVLERRIL